MSATALLVCDIQNGIIERLTNHDTKTYLQQVAKSIEGAREAGIKVFYVRVAFRPGHPEASPRNASVARAKSWGGFVEGDQSTQIHDAIAPSEEDIVVTKRRGSAFHATDLDLLLRSLRIDTLVICGLSTSGVVMSTVRQGSDMDYNFVVLEDLCLDPDQAMHDACLQVLAKQAQMVESADWLAGLGVQN
ncbi:hypothetical protein H2200_010088 [Cladophialophora chaetospira]|uniref:Isochorismatase-like domain-containing protein n=1 Tax=Cladophialophora chaetospira TaxID=386627 RepID=A0AA38X248_9EURO|nr:hypothetical protein H2200_010088 [Cladophialophora chaetospira]